MKATSIARTILATTAGFAYAATLALALAACQADVPADNGTDNGATITLSLGEKPGMTPVDVPATRAFTDYQSSWWQKEDVVKIKVSFYATAPTVGTDGKLTFGTPVAAVAGNSSNVVELTATCTGNGYPPTWSISPATLTLPADATYIRAEYRYEGTEDLLTKTKEIITALTELSNVSSIQSIALPTPTWTRNTALLEVMRVAPGQKVQIKVASQAYRNTEVIPGETSLEGDATITADNSTGTVAATALFHLPMGKMNGTDTYAPGVITYKMNINALYDADHKDASSSKLKNISYSPGEYRIVDARTILPGNGGDDAQVAITDGTADGGLDLTIFNAANPQWMVTGGGTDTGSDGKTNDDKVLGNILAAMEEVAKASATAPIDLTLPDVTTLEISATEPSGGNSTPFQSNTNLRSISAPKVTTISTSQSPFAECTNLTTVSLPAVTTGITDNTFAGCTALTTVEMPAAATVDKAAFADCKNLANLDLSAVTAIDATMFKEHPNLTNVKLPKVTEIGQNAFRECPNLTTIDLDGATKIGESAFTGCAKLATVKLSAVETIGYNAFHDCASLATIDLSSVKTIGIQAFQYCESLTFDKLPEATTIGIQAFQFCTSLTAIELPKATEIGNYAFVECSKLTAIKLPAAEEIGYSAFQSCASFATLDLPKVTTIGDKAFWGCQNLTTLKLTAAGAFTIVDYNGEEMSSGYDLFPYVDTSKCDLYLNEDKKPDASGNATPKATAENVWLGVTWHSITYVSTNN